ncbi:MAG TPA: hypothetical protein DEO56_04715, partial [Nitrosomonas nitrosa]|nr:hypothetical protein [Nitrosomonas nitrosa]
MTVIRSIQSTTNASIDFRNAQRTLLALCIALLLLGAPITAAQAIQGSDKKKEAGIIELSAPKSVRNVIEKYFSFPTEPFSDDTARASFVR